MLLPGSIPGSADLMLARAKLENQWLQGITVDTAAGHCTIVPGLADELGLPLGPRMRNATATGIVERPARFLHQAIFGNRNCYQFAISCVSLPGIPQLPADQQPRFLLGGAQLMDLSPVFDFEGGELLMRAPPVTKLSDFAADNLRREKKDRVFTLPVYPDKEGSTAVYVDVEILGKTERALFDTGISVPLYLTHQARVRLGLPRSRAAWIERGALAIVTVDPGGKKSLDLVARLESFRFGHFVFERPWVQIADPDRDDSGYKERLFDVLVGGGVLLPMARAGIDRERSVLELEPRPNLKRAPNGRFQVAEPGSFLGFLLAAPRSRARGAIDGCPRIGAVCTGGPAAAAGLERGDFLLAIDGRSCAGRPVGELNRGLWPSKGKRIRLRVRDAGGRTRELSLP